MVKTYQLSNEGSYGSSIKVAPITTESQLNQQTCLQVNGSADSKIEPQTIVPDTTGMEVSFLFNVNNEKIYNLNIYINNYF